jgi:PKHD-type hydroxylase
MIHHIPNVLSKEEVAEFRRLMETANWVGGKVTAGTLSASVKRNQQLSEQDPLTHALSERVIQAIWKNPIFQAAALPIILFRRYLTATMKVKPLAFMSITRFA